MGNCNGYNWQEYGQMVLDEDQIVQGIVEEKVIDEKQNKDGR